MRLLRTIYALIGAIMHFLLIRMGGEVFADGMLKTAQSLLKLLNQTNK